MIVLDSSAAIEMIRQTEHGEALSALHDGGERVLSCDLYRAETASVVRKLVRMGKISSDEAEQYYSAMISLVDAFVPIADLQAEALRESIRLDHSTNDMFYFVLARRTGAILFTLDQKLAMLCLKNGVNSILEMKLGEDS